MRYIRFREPDDGGHRPGLMPFHRKRRLENFAKIQVGLWRAALHGRERFDSSGKSGSTPLPAPQFAGHSGFAAISIAYGLSAGHSAACKAITADEVESVGPAYRCLRTVAR
jgi:hypothetical protein